MTMNPRSDRDLPSCLPPAVPPSPCASGARGARVSRRLDAGAPAGACSLTTGDAQSRVARYPCPPRCRPVDGTTAARPLRHRGRCSRCGNVPRARRLHVGEPPLVAQVHTAEGDVLFGDDPGCLCELEAEHRPAVQATWFTTCAWIAGSPPPTSCSWP